MIPYLLTVNVCHQEVHKQRNISLGAQLLLLHKTTFIPKKGLAQFDAADAIHKDIASIKFNRTRGLFAIIT